MLSAASDIVISVQNVETRFGSQRVHRGVSFTIKAGQVVALIGGSGSGKTVLLREIIGLHRPSSGSIQLFGVDIQRADAQQMQQVRQRFGVLFQGGALFSALSVEQNLALTYKEQTNLEPKLIEQLVRLRLTLSGLSPEVGAKMPSELSGGMRKRVALARALSLEPELLFLDEPTSGLDPINARAFDQLIRTLCDCLGLTVMMVTHDLDTLVGIVDQVVVLAEGQVIAQGSPTEVASIQHPWIQSYFSSRVAA